MPYPGLLHPQPLQQATADLYLHRKQFWLSHFALGIRFVCPHLSSSGNQVLGELTVPGGLCVSITSPIPTTQFSGCATTAPSKICHMSPLEVRVRSSLPQGLWVQQTWVWHKPSWRRSPLTPPESRQDSHRTRETDSWRTNKTLCAPGPRDPTETEPELCECLLQRYGSAIA